MQRSKLMLGFVVALGVGGLGAAAVALESDTGGSGALADDTTTTTVVVDPSTTVPTTLAPTTTVAPAPDPGSAVDEPAGDPETTDPETTAPETTEPGVERSTEGCDGGEYANHGQYVSSVAKGADRQPGDVPAAAHSDCGKPITAVGGGDSGDEVVPPETEAPETETGDTGGHGNGNGKSGK